MNLPLFLARHIHNNGDNRQQVSRPAIRIATIGVAVGLAVMIVTVSVIFGFKHTIRDKVVGFGAHIQLLNFNTQQTAIPAPIVVSDSLADALRQVPNVRHVGRYSMTQGILKTDNDFLGVAFKGIGEDYDLTFIRNNMKAGSLPAFSATKSSYQLLISQKMADKLRLAVGSKVFAYFISSDDVRVRKFSVCGIYQSNMKQFDDVLCITDYRIPIRLNQWDDNQCSGAELMVSDFDRINETAAQVVDIIKRENSNKDDDLLTAQTIYEAYPQIFSWLSLLDINVWIILALMTCVAGFTMISGLLIIILERTQTIGILKAIGAQNVTIRHTFLWFATFIIGRGLLVGNIIGIGIVVLQQHTGLVALDPDSYYVSTVPVELNLPIILALNVATLAISLFVLIAPSFLVSHIRPVKAIRFE